LTASKQESSPPSNVAIAHSSAPLHSGRRPRLLIADDHVLVAEAIKNLLEPEFQVVGILSDGRQLLESTDGLRPDLVLLDISMPLLNGLEAGEQIKAKKRAIKLIYVTASDSAVVAAEAFRRGASGYVLKQDEIAELIIAVRQVVRGGSYLASGINRDEFGYHLRMGTKHSSAAKLTTRQREILQLLAEGKRAKEIGYILNIKQGTVSFHKYKIMEALGITTNAGLLEYAISHGITGRSDPPPQIGRHPRQTPRRNSFGHNGFERFKENRRTSKVRMPGLQFVAIDNETMHGRR
jgi:DNA-binding NarL/FixJ family response regulator